MGTPGEERLQRGYRTLRRVTGGTEAPWTGAIVATNDGESGVLVDVALLPDGWKGWDAAPSGHLLSPLDVVRRADGHDVLLPVCTERVIDLLERRRARRTPPSAGEAVTLCVSLLRGLAETEGHDSSTTKGTWWVTDAGRPVLATDTGEGSARDCTVELLMGLSADVPALVLPLAEAIAAARRGSLTRELDRVEPAIFDVAAPQALATTVLTSASLGGAVFAPAAARAVAGDSNIDLVGDASPPREGWTTSMLRHIDADWADVLSRATTAVWRGLRERRPRAGHRRPLLAATAVAGVILVSGLMWPVGDEKPAPADADAGASSSAAPVTSSDTDSDTDTAASESASMSTATAPGDATDTGAPADLAIVAADLLTRRSDCVDDAACLGHVVQTPSGALPGGVIDLPTSARTVVLVDDLGGLAVLRAEAIDGSFPSQLVVIVRRNERCLQRDAYEVTQ